ncbi:TCR/Tet family MFS transporter [Roseibium sediminis]|uniref:TCR/Tet family MFS transporter n=1 Tax=Roseibium sediminis TaxID=1775174 RepID=UPI001AD8F74B|nr:TCR/Tet family MFS transporter [Roseibium sediminis]
MSAHPPTRNSLSFIFVTVALEAMGIGLIVPVLPSLLTEISGSGLSDAARWGGLLTFIYALMQFLFGPALGNLSDHLGRRPVLLTSLFVLAIDYVIMAVAGSLALLIFGRMLAGICGATFSVASAFIADVSSKEDRAKNFGLIGAAFGVGFIIGPALGGLLGEFGARAPFIAAAVLTFVNFLFGYFVLPETLTAGNRRPFSLQRANPLGALRQLMSIPTLGMLLASVLLFDLAHYVYPSIWSYFAAETFHWSPGEIGVSLAVVGVGFAVVQGYIIRVIEPKIGAKRTLYLSLLCNLIAFVALSVVTTGLVAYAFFPFSALGAMATPAYSGLMSNMVADDQQGELQGMLSSVTGIGMIITPVATTQLFAVFTAPGAAIYFPGAPFALSAILIILAAVCAVIGLTPTHKTKLHEAADSKDQTS